MPYLKRRGMGYNPQIGSGGEVVDCDLWSNIFQGVCWNPIASGPPVVPSGQTDASGQPVYTAGVMPTSLGGSNLPWGTIAIVAVIAVLGMTALGSGGARRYGR